MFNAVVKQPLKEKKIVDVKWLNLAGDLLPFTGEGSAPFNLLKCFPLLPNDSLKDFTINN